MKKKALLVGISDYGERLPRLDSPEREIEEWRDLLMDAYGFRCADIRLLANARARREEILFRLNWLFNGAEPDDQLVFFFGGHGMRLTPRNRDTGEILDGMDEAFIAYPSASGDDLDQMAIHDNEFFELFSQQRVPADANVTFILDCCHGGGFNTRDLPRRPAVMSVTTPVDLRHRSLHANRQRADDELETPLIFNAAGELNLSVEIDLDGDRRSLFSFHALKTLRANPRITYAKLLEEIRDPIEQYYPQHANIRGNRSRRHNEFLH